MPCDDWPCTDFGSNDSQGTAWSFQQREENRRARAAAVVLSWRRGHTATDGPATDGLAAANGPAADGAAAGCAGGGRAARCIPRDPKSTLPAWVCWVCFCMSWRAEFWSSGVMAAAPQPAMQMMQVACPAGVSAGQAIQVRPRGCSCRPPAQAAASPRLPALAAFSLFVSAAGCSFPPSSSERLVSRAWTLLQSGCCLQPAA